jgi:hypothetical protein
MSGRPGAEGAPYLRSLLSRSPAWRAGLRDTEGTQFPQISAGRATRRRLWLDNSKEPRLLAAPRSSSAKAVDYWTLRERFEQGEIDIDPDDDKLAAQLGSIKSGIDSRGRSRSNRMTTCASVVCCHQTGPTLQP